MNQVLVEAFDHICSFSAENSTALFVRTRGLGAYGVSLWTDIAAWFDGVKAEFILNCIDKNRWKMLWDGLQNTLLIALLACLMGIAIGIVVAVIRTTWDNTGRGMRKGPGRALLAVFNRICLIYTTIIRGTPVVIQLLIMYYVIFASSNNGLMVATLAFGPVSYTHLARG